MAWEWLVAIDGVLGFGVLGIALVLLIRGPRAESAWLFAIACLMAAFRIGYFVIPALFGGTPPAGLAGIFPGTESVLGVTLVGAMLYYGREGLALAGKFVLGLVFVAALIGIFLGFQDPSTFSTAFAATFLASIFVISTVIAANQWLRNRIYERRRRLLLVLGPLFAWSLNDAIRILHAAVMSPQENALRGYTIGVGVWWLLILGALAIAIFVDSFRSGWATPIPALWGLFAVGVLFGLLQMATTDPTGMRALHLVLDCAAITTIGLTFHRYAGRPMDGERFLEGEEAAPA